MIPHTHSDSHVLAQLDATGAHMPTDLVDHIVTQPDRYAAALRARLATPLSVTCDETAVFARSHALVFLAQWRDTAALDVLYEVLCRDDDMVDGLYDIFEATIPHYGPAALPMLVAVLNNTRAPRAARILCVTTLGLIAHHYPLVARSIGKRLREVLPVSDADGHDDHELWSWVVTTLAELRSKAAAPQVEALYKAGMLDPNICGRPAEYRRALREPAPVLHERATVAQPLSLYS